MSISNPEVMKDKKGYLSEEQVSRLLNATENLRDRLIIQLMYRCGRRVSEVLLLKENDILWEDRMIIFKILKRKKPVTELKVVDENTMRLLEIYLKENPVMKNARKCTDSKTGVLFPITRQAVFKMIRRVGERSGVVMVGDKKIHPHHLRHSFAIHMVKNAIKSPEDIRLLQQYMGHANINTTTHYLQYSPNEQRELIDRMWNKKKK